MNKNLLNIILTYINHKSSYIDELELVSRPIFVDLLYFQYYSKYYTSSISFILEKKEYEDDIKLRITRYDKKNWGIFYVDVK